MISTGDILFALGVWLVLILLAVAGGVAIFYGGERVTDWLRRHTTNREDRSSDDRR